MVLCQGPHHSICTPICRSQAYFFQTCNISANLQKRQMKAKSILSSKEPLFQQDLFSLTYTELAETCRFTFRRYYIKKPYTRKHHLKMCFSITDMWWFQNRIYSRGVGRGCLEQMQFLTVPLPALQSWDWVKLQSHAKSRQLLLSLQSFITTQTVLGWGLTEAAALGNRLAGQFGLFRL